MRRFGGVENVKSVNFRIGVYIEKTLSRRVGFIHSYAFYRRDNLAVYVRFANFVAVDKVDFSDTAAHKRLGTVTAHTAYSENGDMRIFQNIHFFVPEQKAVRMNFSDIFILCKKQIFNSYRFGMFCML